MRIGKKLVLSHLAIAIIPVIILGLIFSRVASQQFHELDLAAHEQGVEVLVEEAKGDIKKQVESALSANTMLKKTAVENYLSVMESRIKIAKDNPFIIDSLKKIDEAYMSAGNSIDTENWRNLTQEINPVFDDISKDNHWKDIYLICPEGSIVYSFLKGKDLGQFCNREPLKNSAIGKV